VRQLVERGARHITFGDPDFLNAPTHSIRIAQALHAKFPSLTFDFTAKIEHLLEHQALLSELAGYGALFVVSAVESLSDRVLAHLAKGHSRADVIEALLLTREAGLTLRPSLVTFTPWTTMDDMLDLIAWVERDELVDAIDPVQFSIRLLVPPGSLLVTDPAMTPHLGELDPVALGYRWAHPDPRMDALQRELAAIAAAAADASEDAALTFRRVRAAVHRAAGVKVGNTAPDAPAERARAPRLTEPWFC
jgi:hypothetical protein